LTELTFVDRDFYENNAAGIQLGAE